jgi:hypothetical protein
MRMPMRMRIRIRIRMMPQNEVLQGVLNYDINECVLLLINA